jgi:hypothetical protein
MRRIVAGSLFMGLWVSAARAGDSTPTWQPAAGSYQSPVSLGRPVAAPPPAAARVLPANLDRPVAAATSAGPVLQVTDTQLAPASFSSTLGTIFRAKTDEPQRMPAGKPSEQAARKPQSDGPNLDAKSEEVPAPRVVRSAPVTPSGPPILAGDGCADSGDMCAAGACCPCPDCLQENTCNRWWARAEYLLWQLRRDNLPPLMTTSPPTSLGVLGMPGTQVLFGGKQGEEQSGGRLTLGYWFDPCHDVGVEATYFFLGERSTHFSATSLGTPLLARPFFDTATGAEDAELVANPLIPTLPNVLPLTGTVSVSEVTRFWGVEANAVLNIDRWACSRLDLLLGGRYIRLSDDLNINEGLLVPPTSPMFAGTTFRVNDHFGTHNDFYAGQIGLRGEWRWRRFFVEGTGKVALGDMHEVVSINGATIITPAGGTPVFFSGGLLTQPTNIGHYTHDTFAVAPEAGINVGYQVTDWLRAYVGYNAIYISNVARPGIEIDRAVNPSQLPTATGRPPLVGPARPAFTFHDTDFWAQGINVGLEFRY